MQCGTEKNVLIFLKLNKKAHKKALLQKNPNHCAMLGTEKNV